MKQLLKQGLLVYVCLFVLTGQAIADALTEQNQASKGIDLKVELENAAKSIRLLAAQGNADAQAKLGSMYEMGLGVPQDYKEAAKWYRLAAEQGVVLAQTQLGSMYGKGQGVPQDYKEAVKWLR